MTSPALPDAERRAYEANLAKFFVYSSLWSFQLWIPIWIIYLQQQRGLSLTEITFLDAPFFLTQVLAEIPTGALADRFGRKTSLLLGGATISVAVFVFGIADNYPLILTSYVFWGIGMGLQSGADQAFVFDSLKLLGRQADYSRVMGRISAATLVASIVAALLGAPLAAATSLATPVIVSSFIGAASVLVAATFKEPPQHGERLPYLQTISSGLGQVTSRPVLRLVVLFGIFAMMSGWVTQYFMQPFLKGHGASTASLGLFLLPARLVSVGASVGAHRMESRLGSWRAIALTPLISVGACAGLAAWDSIYAFAFVPMAAAAGTVRVLLVSQYINNRIPSGQRATIMSIYALGGALANSFCAPAFGYIADERSLQFMYGTVAVFGALTLPLLLYLWRRAERREEELATGGAASAGAQE